MEKRDAIILKFLEIPAPIGTAGAFIWAIAAFMEKWDPHKYADFENVFDIFWVKAYTLLIILALFLYYLYIYIKPIRSYRLRYNIRIAENKHKPPMNMVLVPEGSFKFGRDGKEILLASFFIDRYLVTNEEYKKFVDDTGHSPPENWADGIPPSDKLLHPVTCVKWFDAKDFCKWRSEKLHLKVDLPTEEQWEKAARGPFGYHYPWGNDFERDWCNIGKGIEGKTNPIDAYPMGRSLYGCYDMCGNVWEWTNSFYDPNKEIAVLRGGSFYFDEGFSSLWLRYHDPCKDKWFDLGFRCAHLI